MAKIEKLVTRLENYRAKYSAESGTVDLFIDLLQTNRLRSFDRALLEGHVTASCWLLNRVQSHVLLTHHRKLNRWIQLGGHADGETDPAVTALQEAREESAIDNLEFLLNGDIFDIDRHVIPARKNEPEHFHYDFRFAMRSIEHDNYTVSDESHDLRWVEITRLTEYTLDESVLRMGRKWLSQLP